MATVGSSSFMGVSANWRVVSVDSPDQPRKCNGRIRAGNTELSFSAFLRWCSWKKWSVDEVKALVKQQLRVPLQDATFDAQLGDGARVRRGGKSHHGSVRPIPAKDEAIFERARRRAAENSAGDGQASWKQRTPRLPPEEADDATTTESTGYNPDGVDRRRVVERQIKERRGRQQFRDAMRKRYRERCAVTECAVLDVLEAAHISPYRGENDNDPENGLLLRADIHTLFDLDLLGIDPDTLRIQVHPDIKSEYGHLAGQPLRCSGNTRPSRSALTNRYELFCERLAR